MPYVKGHYRTLPDGRRIFVRGHYRGGHYVTDPGQLLVKTTAALSQVLEEIKTICRRGAQPDETIWRGDRIEVLGRLVSAISLLMPPTTRRRWLDNIAEALHDFEPELHQRLLRDFLVHAPAVVVRSWTVDLPRRVLGMARSPERHDDRTRW